MCVLLSGWRRAVVLLCVLGVGRAASGQDVAPGAKSFVWRIDGGANVLYLAGSVHALSRDAYPLPAAFDRAFESSDTLVEEVDVAELDAATLGPQVMAMGLARDGRTLERALAPALYARLIARLATRGVTAEMVNPLKAWMAVVMLSALEIQRAGMNADLGVDKHFFEKARTAGRAVVGLETAASQLARFDGLSDAAQEQLLRTTLDELDAPADHIADLVSAWKRGDAAAIETLTVDALREHPEVYDALIVARNRSWMAQLEECVAKRRCFVVVGAAHLVGPDGLLRMLEQRGFRVVQQ